MDCIFCDIVSGSIPADIVYDDDEFIAFRDIHPQAPVHIVIIPHRHISSVNDLRVTDQALAGVMVLIAKNVAQQEGIARSGYRLVFNCGTDGTQEVPHLHLHLLGGHPLSNQLG